MIDLVKALGLIDIGKREDFYYTSRSLLIHQREDLPLFDQAFELFWQAHSQKNVIEIHGAGQKDKRLVIKPPPLENSAPPGLKWNQDDPTGEDQPLELELTQTYSHSEVLRKKDFAKMTADELADVQQMMALLIWQLGARQTRRQRPGSGQFLDFRRTFRGALRHGGEALIWEHQRPKIKPRPLIIIADVSGSMERYTRLLLHFVHSIVRGLEQRVEIFVFSTRLTCITRQLKNRKVDQALNEVSKTVPDWSGGTRIGQVIKTFNFQWGRRVLGGGAVVLFISDGWDRGDPDLLRKEMERLQRSCYRLIWLNPLLGSPEYEPLTRGAQTALRYVDDFLPVHNLASLENLGEHLSKLDQKRQPHR
jgi:uncharacterized protein with von Willebrand factor type A (vWA) domain